MVSFAFLVKNIGKKSGKKQGWCSDVAELFTSSVHISKYGNQCKDNQKIRKKEEKKRIDMIWQFLTTLGQSVHMSKYGS